MSKFVHLHVHSMYSLLDGLSKIDQLVQKAKEEQMDALALTDHGVMYGLIEFYQKCQEAGIKPILGLEAYVAPRTMLDKQPKIDTSPSHLLLLAKNQQGYQNLIQLSTAGHLQGYYYKPRIDKEILRKHSAGLICLTSCLQGDVSRAVLSNNLGRAETLVREYQEIFGRENFYLEVQDHPNIPEQKIATQKFQQLSRETGAGLVATNDVHYLNPQDQEAHEILLCVQTGKIYDDENRLSMKEDDFSFRPTEAMEKSFQDIPEAIENTKKIAEQCNLQLSLGKFILPNFPLPKRETDNDYLKKLCSQGLKKRFSGQVKEEVLKRLEEELSVIKKAGFAPYFLIVQDFVNWAREQGIPKGPGRGSAAGSLVSYLLGITDINPLKYNLLFERFLSKEGERVVPPDIDLDFAEDRRDEVIEYITQKYGQEKVAQIVTFGTMASRAAVRDVARALGMTYLQGDEIAKLIPFGLSLDKALEASPLLNERYKNEPEARRLINLARQLEGVARHASTHAAGVVIGRDALTNYVPLQKEAKEKNIVTQYSMYDLEALGLLKIDILGLANLTIIENTLKIIKKTKGKELILAQIPFDDQKVYRLFSRGETQAVFQLESEGMKKWLKELKPTEFRDIIAMIALYRPGPISWIPDYIAAKHARKKPTYFHPNLEPILGETHGVPIFQEQILQIARDLAGFSYAEADVLRKAIGKKIKKLLLAQREKFILGCIRNKIKKELAEQIFQFIEPFARYSFNRAHSTCYALISYWTGYLKTHYPSEYMAAFLTNDQTDLDKLTLAIKECERMKIKVLPPDVNESRSDFSVVPETGNIRFGLAAIKNVGGKAAELIIEERKKNGRYQSLEEFSKRLDSSVLNKKVLESLIKSGALDRFGERTSFLAGIDQLLKLVQHGNKARQSNQLDLFSGKGSLPQVHLAAALLPNVPPASKNQKLAWEKELLGMYLSEHPLGEFNYIWEKGRVIPTSELSLEMLNREVEVAGIVAKIQKVITKNNSEMAFVRLEDIGGLIEIVVFPKVLERAREFLEKDKMLLVRGKVSEKDRVVKIIADEIKEMAEELKTVTPSKSSDRLYLTIPLGSKKEFLEKLKEIILAYAGESPVILRFPQNGGFEEVKVKSKVKISKILLEKLTELLGIGRVEVR